MRHPLSHRFHVARVGALACLLVGACAGSETGGSTPGSGGSAAGDNGTAGTTGPGTGGSGTAGATGSGGAGAGGASTGTGGGAGSGTPGAGGNAGAGTAGAGAGGAAGTAGGAGATGRGGAAGSGTAGRGGAAGTGTAGRGGAAGTGTAGSGTAGRGGAAGTGTAGATGTGGSTGTGGGSSNCMTPPAASPLVGWGSGTTGGGSVTPQMVSTVSALNSAAAGSGNAVIYVTGKLPNGNITIGSNKTIVGLCGAEIHGHVDIVRSSNVIVRNIKIVGYGVGDCSLDPSYTSSVGCSSGNDAITVEQGSHIWFDHDDISDGTDGNLDITLGADLVTVSWTKFHYTPRTDNSGNDSTGAAGHRYSSLVGGGDNSPGDVGKLNITWHHDWWADNVVERQPRIRYGKNHLYNNLWSSTAANYCVRAGMDAMILLESNAFVGVRNPTQFNSSADQMTSYITAPTTGSNANLLTNTSGSAPTGGGGTPFTMPTYTYTLDAASGVQAAVMAGAGPQ
jgi:pectate lyase